MRVIKNIGYYYLDITNLLVYLHILKLLHHSYNIRNSTIIILNKLLTQLIKIKRMKKLEEHQIKVAVRGMAININAVKKV